MQMTWPTALSWACLVLGVLLYLAAVTGILFGEPTPPADVGLVSTTLVLVLFGAVGLRVTRQKPAA